MQAKQGSRASCSAGATPWQGVALQKTIKKGARADRPLLSAKALTAVQAQQMAMLAVKHARLVTEQPNMFFQGEQS